MIKQTRRFAMPAPKKIEPVVDEPEVLVNEKSEPVNSDSDSSGIDGGELHEK